MRNFFAGFLIGECTPMNMVVKPLLTFGFRFYLAYVFFKSGLTKVDDTFKVTDSAISLMADFKVPFLPVDVATYLAAYAELILPILLVIGFLSRPAALALFILNAVAAYALAHSEYASVVGNWQHILWGTMIAVIFAFGPGKVSIDSWISNKLYGKESNLLVKIVSIAVLGGISYLLASKFL